MHFDADSRLHYSFDFCMVYTLEGDPQRPLFGSAPAPICSDVHHHYIIFISHITISHIHDMNLLYEAEMAFVRPSDRPIDSWFMHRST